MGKVTMETATEAERYRKLANDWRNLYKGSWDARRSEINLIENWAQLLEVSLKEYPSTLQSTVESVIRQMTNRVNTFREVWQNDSE